MKGSVITSFGKVVIQAEGRAVAVRDSKCFADLCKSFAAVKKSFTLLVFDFQYQHIIQKIP